MHRWQRDCDPWPCESGVCQKDYLASQRPAEKKSTEGFECLINSPIMQVLKLKLFQKAFWSSHILSRTISIIDLNTKQSHPGPLWYAVNGCWTRRERNSFLSLPARVCPDLAYLWHLLLEASTLIRFNFQEGHSSQGRKWPRWKLNLTSQGHI